MPTNNEYRIRVRERHLTAIRAVLEQRFGVKADIRTLRANWQRLYDEQYASGLDPEGYIEQLRAKGMSEEEITSMLVRQGQRGLRGAK